MKNKKSNLTTYFFVLFAFFAIFFVATKVNTSKNNMTAGDYSETTDDKVAVIQESEAEASEEANIENENIPSTSSTATFANTSTSPKEVRAQMYIDKGWAPDETINEDTYRGLGGQHTQYWDNLKANQTITKTKSVTTAANAPIK